MCVLQIRGIDGDGEISATKERYSEEAVRGCDGDGEREAQRYAESVNDGVEVAEKKRRKLGSMGAGGARF
jgi:hypothetical protein